MTRLFPAIGIQLFMVRGAWGRDPAGTLRRLGAMGYEGVELFFHELDGAGRISGVAAAQVAGWLREAGLKPLGTHVPGSPEADWDALMDFNAELGCAAMGIGAAFYVDNADAHRVAAELNAKAERCRARGLGLYYHNHFHEFQRLGGETPMDVLLREAPALQLEPDVYWLARAGVDPVDFIRRNGARIAMLHLKDLSPAATPVNLLEAVTGRLVPENVFTAAKDTDSVEIGAGCLDMAAILAEALKHATISGWIVEQDCCAGDELVSAEKSLAGLRALAAG